MSSYRIYKYPLKEQRFRHIYFKRDLRMGHREGEPKKKEPHTGRFEVSLIRTRRTVRDLVFCNHFDYFCTFTFSPEKIDRFDFQACKKKITRIFDNYKQRYSPSFRYVLVPEQHKNGAWHFHGMVSGIREVDFVVPATIWIHPNKKSEELVEVPNIHGYVDWNYYSKKLGFFSCSKVRDYERCAVYVSKYITKNLLTVIPGAQLVLASKNLRRPELIFDCDGVPCEFEPAYTDDFCSISWQGDTFSERYIDPLRWEGCSDLYDPAFLDEPASEIFEPLTGDQLRLSLH